MSLQLQPVKSPRKTQPSSSRCSTNASVTYKIYPRMIELPGEVLKQVNNPWAMTFVCRLMGHMDRRVHLLLNVFPPGFIHRSLPGRGGRVRDLWWFQLQSGAHSWVWVLRQHVTLNYIVCGRLLWAGLHTSFECCALPMGQLNVCLFTFWQLYYSF